MFRYRGGYFTNIQNKKVLDVQGAKDQEGNNVQVHKRNNGRHQRWRIVYKDKMGHDGFKKKGQRSHKFGFLVGEPFYLRSKLPFQRVVEAIGANDLVQKNWVRGRRA